MITEPLSYFFVYEKLQKQEPKEKFEREREREEQNNRVLSIKIIDKYGNNKNKFASPRKSIQLYF